MKVFKLLSVLMIVMLLTFTLSGAVVAQDEDGVDGPAPAPPPVLVDADGDGVADGVDACPDTPLGAVVDANGCSAEAPSEALPEEPPEEPGEAELPPEEVAPVAPADPPDAPVEAPVEVDAEPTPVLEAVPAEPEVVEVPAEGVGPSQAPTYQYVSGVQVVNLDATNSAAVTGTFYDTNGTPVGTINETVSGGGTATWYVPDRTEIPGTFTVGSAVVSADRQIAATLNTQTPSASGSTTTDPKRIGQAGGVGSPTTSAYVPQVMRDYYGWNSYVAVQNAGSSTASVSVRFYDSTGAEVTAAAQTASIAAYASYIFDQATNTNLPGSAAYSAYVDGGGQNVAVVCNMLASGADYANSQLLSYNGVGAGANMVYIPRLVKDYYNYQSGMAIMNVSSTATTVQVEYDFGGTKYTQTSPSLGQYQAWQPYLGNEAAVPPLAGVSGSGSAVVTVQATGAMVIATINEDNRVSPAGRGTTYNAFSTADATHNVVFPQVTGKYYAFSGGWQVQSLVDSNSCTVTYSTFGGVTPTGRSFTLSAGGSTFDFVPDKMGTAVDYNGSAKVVCSGNVVGIQNMSIRDDIDARYGTYYGDSYTQTGGINY